MPQLAFLQALVVAALVSFVLVVVAFPVGAKVSWQAARTLIRVSLGLLVVGFAGAIAWGASNGELVTFRSTLGPDAAIEMGMFFLIMYGTGFMFVSRFIATMAAESAGKEDTDA
ncbi:MAG: hypothetical protein CVT59_07890 [Actinobacteria bacterium HGW-Actinobacteria-1]|nr:MAG: hypothetical protein CVT59_07890 [Actinobacteria bacterium HGW-Actinobacteria-1]